MAEHQDMEIDFNEIRQESLKSLGIATDDQLRNMHGVAFHSLTTVLAAMNAVAVSQDTVTRYRGYRIMARRTRELADRLDTLMHVSYERVHHGLPVPSLVQVESANEQELSHMEKLFWEDVRRYGNLSD